ncbi:MAG: nucleoid-associated protein [Erysipelotrichaceae bacterium]
MVEIIKQALHLLDCEANSLITSEVEMTNDEVVERMLLSKLQKIFNSSNIKRGSFSNDHILAIDLLKYETSDLNFIDLSISFAKVLFDTKMKHGDYRNADFIFTEVLLDGERYYLGIENSYQDSYVHHASIEAGDTMNQIVHQSSLSANLLKQDRVMMINAYSKELSIIENPVEIDAQSCNFLCQCVFQISFPPSYDESVQTIQKISDNLIEKYNLDETELKPKVKQVIKDCVESNDAEIVVDHVANTLFPTNTTIKEDFVYQMNEKGIDKPIQAINAKITSKESVQKFRTDSGIEISIPVDTLYDKEKVEIIHQADGMISIKLKQITKLKTKA